MKGDKALSIIAAVVIAALVLSASVTAVLFDRGAYARLQEKLDLAGNAGLSGEEVLDNYNALIDYNSVFFTGPLEFPSLPMSVSGRIHFEEVKALFSAFQIVLIVTAALTAVFSYILLKRRSFRFLTLGGILTLAVPAVIVCIMAAVGWDRFFVLFHELFFDNEFWVFDAVTDPVILLLPDAFFLSCLLRIMAGIVITAILLIFGPIQALKGKTSKKT